MRGCLEQRSASNATRDVDVGDLSFTRRLIAVMLLAPLLLISACSPHVGSELSDAEVREIYTTWIMSTGLVRDEPAVWRDRLAEACDAEVWQRGVANRLAERFVTEDADLAMDGVQLSPELNAAAADALWLMSVQVCSERFPEDAISNGPPSHHQED